MPLNNTSKAKKNSNNIKQVLYTYYQMNTKNKSNNTSNTNKIEKYTNSLSPSDIFRLDRLIYKYKQTDNYEHVLRELLLLLIDYDHNKHVLYILESVDVDHGTKLMSVLFKLHAFKITSLFSVLYGYYMYMYMQNNIQDYITNMNIVISLLYDMNKKDTSPDKKDTSPESTFTIEHEFGPIVRPIQSRNIPAMPNKSKRNTTRKTSK
jgi:hypothetical protein